MDYTNPYFSWADPRAVFLTRCYIANLSALGADTAIGLLMMGAVLYRTRTKTEQYAKQWEQTTFIYCWHNFPNFCCALTSALAYLFVNNSTVNSMFWVMFIGMQAIGRAVVYFTTYSKVLSLPKPVTKEQEAAVTNPVDTECVENTV